MNGIWKFDPLLNLNKLFCWQKLTADHNTQPVRCIAHRRSQHTASSVYYAAHYVFSSRLLFFLFFFLTRALDWRERPKTTTFAWPGSKLPKMRLSRENVRSQSPRPTKLHNSWVSISECRLVHFFVEHQLLTPLTFCEPVSKGPDPDQRESPAWLSATAGATVYF